MQAVIRGITLKFVMWILVKFGNKTESRSLELTSDACKFAVVHWLGLSPLQQCSHYRGSLWSLPNAINEEKTTDIKTIDPVDNDMRETIMQRSFVSS